MSGNGILSLFFVRMVAMGLGVWLLFGVYINICYIMDINSS
jgi:uncharacterized protein with PQ loop repeat